MNKLDLIVEAWRENIPAELPPHYILKFWLRLDMAVILEALDITNQKIERLRNAGVSMTDKEIGKYCSGTLKHLTEWQAENDHAS